MRVLTKKTLRDFWESHADAQEALEVWHKVAEQAAWLSPAEVKAAFGSASILSDNRVCFNIKGNTYRLIVAIEYRKGFVLVKWVGTHAEYDKINAETVNDH